MKLVLCVLLSLLAASASAQSCVRLTRSDLGNQDAPTDVGLISALLTLESGGGPVMVQVSHFQIVCEVTAGSVDRYRQVSVVAEYSADGVNTTSQFEFNCVSGDVWGLLPNRPTDSTITTPPDASIDTEPRRDCSNCLSPNRAGSSASGVNHCDACPSHCVGLRQCTGVTPFVTCCNYYNQDGRCTEQCSSSMVVLPPDNTTCGCPPGTTGTDCNTDINECNVMPCENGGTCQNSFGSYSCRCLGNWVGQDCGTCGIRDCSICSSDGSRCLSCVDGYAIGDDNTCSIIAPCDPPCVNGACQLDGICRCNPGYGGTDCSETVCATLRFCNRCVRSSVCDQCQDGYEAIEGLCVLTDSTRIVLTQIHIAAIAVSCCIVFFLGVALIMCFVTRFMCNRKPGGYAKSTTQQHKRKKPNKHFVKKQKNTKTLEDTSMVNSAATDMGEDGLEEKAGGELTLF